MAAHIPGQIPKTDKRLSHKVIGFHRSLATSPSLSGKNRKMETVCLAFFCAALTLPRWNVLQKKGDFFGHHRRLRGRAAV